MIARVARETFGVERVVARIYDPRRAAIYQRLGIPTVATVAWTSERVLRRVLPDEPALDWGGPRAHVMLVERGVAAGWGRPSLAELPGDGELRVMAVSRLGVAKIPNQDLVVQEGDVLYLAVAGDRLASLDNRLAAPARAGGH